jgi:hypothetical protein
MTARGKATYQDVIDAPPNMVAEIIYGTLVTSPQPRIRHAVVASALGGVLSPKFGWGDGGPGGWVLLDEPELHFGEDVLVPDLAAWKRERYGTPGDVAFLTLAPDWVCEVLSPSTAALDRTSKLEIYARERVAHAWLVDPATQTLEAFRLDGDSWRLVHVWAGAAKARAEPFDAVELDLTRLWNA